LPTRALARKPYRRSSIDSSHEYIVAPAINELIDITSYYCMIPKMVILHDAIKTIQNRVFVFFVKRTNSSVFIKRTKNSFFQKKTKKQEG